MTLSAHWNSLAARLGTSPKQLALLLASAAGAVGIFGGKLILTPASASAAPVPAPAPAVTTPAAANTASATALPASYLAAAPRWNLPTRPSRNPFESPDDGPRGTAGQVGTASNEGAAPGIDLQATLDFQLAVINGRTVRVGQDWTDAKSGRTFRLVEVSERSARFSSGGRIYEIPLDG